MNQVFPCVPSSKNGSRVHCYKFNILLGLIILYRAMTLNPKSLPKGSAKRKPATAENNSDNRMTAAEEKTVAKAFQELKEGKARTFKNADEYLKYLDTV
jgi:hypothetical protein